MKSSEIRQQFLDFFEKKQHKIVESAPMVSKDDPTLMFTNAGMNQFKDFFLGHSAPSSKRIADTQKCLRVSGKHNDLEEVGKDSYHHTMFEMLGNWSFGDYFKTEAIAWGWELLTEVYGLPKDRLYVTVFGGDESEGLERDSEAAALWGKWIAEDRILDFGKKDNFWEMGDTGPCGPCSEIHIDLRSDEERSAVPGASLVNEDHPQVIELWNLVFIQYNRKADSSLETLPEKHVDTGMGFERLAMVIQGKMSSYDSDVFTPLIKHIETATGITYTGDYSDNAMSDIAMRVVADHVRALFFGIADGQLPSNTGAGYVLRRILRRAVRYYFSFLNVKEPFLHTLVPLLDDYFGDVFAGVRDQAAFVDKVIHEEERSFLRTLDSGLKRLDKVMVQDGKIDGAEAFELYDTYGFPIDLTRLIGEERGLTVDEAGFESALKEQKERSRADARKQVGDWMEVSPGEPTFVGYDQLTVESSKILKYREIESKGKSLYQLVLDPTPFYPEGGGQVGDKGRLIAGDQVIKIVDSVKENDLPIVVVAQLPDDVSSALKAEVIESTRRLTENNHSATHLLHAALREVLGTHVQQKGSLVKDDHLRFDFSHFQKMTEEEVKQVEKIVNERVRQNIPRSIDHVPIEEAKERGAMMLFGEKYGDEVRMITFDPEYSVELCGGCHVPYTGKIGLFKITSESAIAAGVRRIEAVTADRAEEYVNDKLDQLHEVANLMKNPADVVQSLHSLMEENKSLRKDLEDALRQQVKGMREELISEMEEVSGVRFLGKRLDIDSKSAKDLVYQLIDAVPNAVVLIGMESDGKAQLHLGISKAIAEKDALDAGKMIRDIARSIQGGGGGQPFYASAGGKNPAGIAEAINTGRTLLEEIAD